MRTGQIPLCFGPQIRRTPTNGNESSGSLLPGPVTSFVVCATPVSEQGPVHAQPVVVTGAAAHSLAASLSNAATSPVRTVCPFNNATTRTTLTMTPVTATGQHLPALSATIESAACSATVTNGTTTRYGWRLPPRVAALLRVAMSPSGPEMPIDLVPSRFHKASGSPSH
jgi:septal ring-binding cell division protein DamX